MCDIDDLDDAIIEDTAHCDLCGFPWVLGSNGDGVIVNLPPRGHGESGPIFDGRIGGQLKLCFDCAAMVSRTYEQELAKQDRCEHHVLCGDWCEPCNQAYREARENGGDCD